MLQLISYYKENISSIRKKENSFHNLYKMRDNHKFYKLLTPRWQNRVKEEIFRTWNRVWPFLGKAQCLVKSCISKQRSPNVYLFGRQFLQFLENMQCLSDVGFSEPGY